MRKYKVEIIEEAEKDLIEIYKYISIRGSIQRAESIINKIEGLCLKLEAFPERGRVVSELKKISILSFREVIHKPFRIIYQIIKNRVFVHAVLDSRRNLEDLLYHRLIKL